MGGKGGIRGVEEGEEVRWKGRRYGKELVKGWGVREGERIRGVRKGREKEYERK